MFTFFRFEKVCKYSDAVPGTPTHPTPPPHLSLPPLSSSSSSSPLPPSPPPPQKCAASDRTSVCRGGRCRQCVTLHKASALTQNSRRGSRPVSLHFDWPSVCVCVYSFSDSTRQRLSLSLPTFLLLRRIKQLVSSPRVHTSLRLVSELFFALLTSNRRPSHLACVMFAKSSALCKR